ncbi:MAG: rhodanese-like domain-containing protein [Vulcanimicrobiaceae bacterium]
MTHSNEPAALADPQQLCPTLTLRKVTEEGALLVDVRERDEVAALAFDVPDIVHIPLSEFERRFVELPRERELIVVCTDGQRSLKAAYHLIDQGYTRVANLEGGLAQWVRKRFPVKSSTAPSVVPAAAAGYCTTTEPPSGGCCGPTTASAKDDSEPAASGSRCGGTDA